MSAIFMGKDYELVVYSKDSLAWDKADLGFATVVNPTGVSNGIDQ